MRTMLLDPATWDITLDAAGNIALADENLSLAQDAASAIRLWQGELYYDTLKGVPWRKLLGAAIPLSLVKSKLVDAALTVPGIKSARVFFSSIDADRTLHGQVQISTSTNFANPLVAAF